MKAFAKIILFAEAALLVSLSMRCTNMGWVSSSPGGGSGSEVGSVVIGKLYQPDGKLPACSASVVMRSRNYLPKIPSLGKHSANNEFFVCKKFTDSLGYYKFTATDAIPQDMYCIEGRDRGNNCILIDSVWIDSSILNDTVPPHTLKPPGTVKDTISWHNDSTKTFIRVFGLDVCAGPDSSGIVTLANLPQGNLRLHFSIIQGNEKTYDATVATLSGGIIILNVSDSVEGVFPLNSFIKEYVFDSLQGYMSTQSFSVRQTSDKGYAIAGTIYNYSDNASQASGAPSRTCIFLVKTDEKGELQWKHLYNNAIGFNNGYCVRQTSDAGFIVVGESNAGGSGGFDIIAIKTTSSGEAEWIRYFGGAGYDHGYSVQQTTDGGYIISGKTDSLNGMSAIYIVKTNPNGTIAWSRTFDDKGKGNSIFQTKDGGYIFTGTGNENTQGARLIKIGAVGDVLWTKPYGSSDGFTEGKSIQQAADGGYFLSGSTVGTKTYVLKTDSAGSVIWTNIIGAGENDQYDCKSGSQTHDNGFIVSGQKYSTSTSSSTNKYSLFLAKTDATGKTAWIRVIGNGSGYLHTGTFGNSVQETDEGGFILAGHKENNYGVLPVVLIKTDVNGYVQ